VGSYCGAWAFVLPEGREEFTNFTLAILDIATLASASRTSAKPQQAMKLEHLMELKQSTQESKTITDSEKAQKIKSLDEEIEKTIDSLSTPDEPLVTPRVQPFPFPAPPQ
jgi:hypothetical protein